VPERHPVGAGDQHPGGDRLVHDPGQVHRLAAGDHAQVGHGRLRTEQGGDAQHLPGRLGQEIQPGADRRGQRPGYPGAVQLGRPVGDPDAFLPQQGFDQLPQVQRVPAGLIDRGAQSRPGRRAGQPPGQLVHRRGFQRRHGQQHGVRPLDAAAQRGHLGPARYRPARGHQKQRYLSDQPS
jgi:hypothetical protein